MTKTSARVLVSGVVTVVSLLLVACSPVASESPAGEATTGPVAAETTEAEAVGGGVSSSAGAYIAYDDYERNPSAYSDTAVVLFFNAAWCSTCKRARDNIEADLSAIPADLTIVVVDFDTAIDLRRTHDVGVQHTFVQIDNQGNQIKKWSGSVTTGEIYERIQ
jgi:thiol-disulfide isomerase/thioredoxin